MPRKPRMYVAGLACHVIQRGNNRSVCFITDADYQFYLECLFDGCRRYRVSVHAYVLMSNHVHLLMTPNTDDGVSRLMQSLGRRYVQYINGRYRRSGTLWEGRHKASLVQADRYLLACYRYIELNPVRAAMVTHPADYRWSSYRANAYGELNEQLTPHEAYLTLGETPDARQSSYRQLFATELEACDLNAIRRAANFAMPLGNDRFKAQIEAELKRSIGQARRGRPVKRGGREGDN